MPILRKVGIRTPWLPSPLDSGGAPPPADALRPVIVIGAIVPTLLLGGMTQPVGMPREPNVDPLRPTTIQVGQVPVPGASVWMPTPARLPNTDPLRPTTLQVGQVPVPGAFVWEPTPARLPNSDPLRPVIVGQDAPDASLVQPATIWTSRLPRDEDLSRPARPAVVQVGGVPVPGASVALIRAGREAAAAPPEERLAFTVALVAQPPLPGSIVAPVGRITSTPTDRLAPPLVVQGQVSQPGAQALILPTPRDAGVVIADRLSPTLVIGVGYVPPGALAYVVGWPRLAPDRVPSKGLMLVNVLLDRPPGASVSFLRVLREFGEIFAHVFIDGRVRSPAPGSAVQGGGAGRVIGEKASGDVESPGRSGRVKGE